MRFDKIDQPDAPLEQVVANASARIRESPKCDRPRERLLSDGAGTLRTAELVAILIRSGRSGESALQAGEKIAARYAEHIERLPLATRAELKAISKSVGVTAFCQIMAGIELGRRVADAVSARQPPAAIRSAADAIAFCRNRFRRLAEHGTQEEFHVVTLDTKNQVIDTHRVTIGLLDETIVHPREVFRPAIRDGAKSIVLVHNHPSGDCTPSACDRLVTERLEAAGATVGIEVLDHVIVAGNRARSLRAAGDMRPVPDRR